ncbi:protein-tyrosine phosphatase family protein [Verrucosispora sp. WMMC514]|uniref:protein-tyrosine phosphatase family protein n=1 Tax=Verrucosispora sp. WMMC514 TaxID=3015156 RepID=UPI00248D0EFE|nr:protein-tyrosine phosphatase family protein [Verrucosispora sp. WMMC514]WBB90910.1 protein phosphatase [Verrucosispora sp. WMMC514]
MRGSDWADGAGVVELPGGVRMRGRRIGDPATPADFSLLLAAGPVPGWAYRRVRWPDFWVPLDRADALDALGEALRRGYAGQRVEVACRGGTGRTGTALAALAVLDGLPAEDAVDWVRAAYRPDAVETPWQRRWLRRLSAV